MRNTSANGTASPWPFRIDAEYGTIYEAFTGDVVTELRLFDELITLGVPNSPNYTVARNAARAWMLTYVVGAPTNANNYYEDFGSDPANYNNYILGETASYLLDNPGIDSSYLADAEKLISFEETQLVFNFPGLANGPGEQIDYNYPTPDAASRYALVCAKIAKAGGGVTYYNKAFWAFNLVTYFMVAISGSTAGQVSTAILPSLAITSINNPNGGLVTINTAAPTGFGSDSLNPNAIVISGVSGQTSINGTWGISIVSPTSFTLDGAIGNGVSSNDGYESYVVPNAWWRVSWETIIHMTQAISLYPAWGVTN